MDKPYEVNTQGQAVLFAAEPVQRDLCGNVVEPAARRGKRSDDEGQTSARPADRVAPRSPSQLIGIEEPENYLHPRLLAEFAEECRNASERTQLS